MHGSNRAPYYQLASAAGETLTLVPLLHRGPALDVDAALELLGERGRHQALDPAEGVMYRLERKGQVEFLAKFVREDFTPGRLLPEISGGEAVWNWRPSKTPAPLEPALEPAHA